MSETISRVVLEAELALAPVKVQATLEAVAKGLDRFVPLFGPPTPGAVQRVILASLLIADASRADVQWLIDADFMPVDFMAEWEAAR